MEQEKSLKGYMNTDYDLDYRQENSNFEFHF